MTDPAGPDRRVAVQYVGPELRPIGGVHAVLRGWVGSPAFRARFDATVLVGFDRPDLADFRTVFDSRRTGPGADPEWAAIAGRFGTPVRVAVGKLAGVDVHAILVNPDGARRSEQDRFYDDVRAAFGVDLRRYERYPAIEEREGRYLERVLARDPSVRPAPDRPLLDPLGRELYGGVPYLRGPEGLSAAFPTTGSLDTFSGFEGKNRYVIELQAHCSVARPAVAAVTALLRSWNLSPADATLFLHDSPAVPFLWAALLAGYPPSRAVFVAHECRLYRLLVEGVMWDKAREIAPHCSLDGHDCGVYPHLADAEARGLGLDRAFPGNTFDDVYYHVFTREAARCGRVLAVGENVAREMRAVLGDRADPKLVRVCPNGIPAKPVTPDEVTAAGRRLRAVVRHTLGFEPEFVFTSVGRFELSKAPWRTVGFAERFAADHPGTSFVLYWLARPRRLPTDGEVREWGRWQPEGWPLAHRPREDGGDLSRSEAVLWERVRRFNDAHRGRCRVVFLNQFGWDRGRLGALDPLDSTFADLRTGTDADLGLSVYGPFEIAPLEPFPSGAVSVVSDACGCAAHLEALHRAGAISDDGFAIGRFTRHPFAPAEIDLQKLAEIEDRVYAGLAAELMRKLRIPRADRLRAAQAAVPLLSWDAIVRDHLLPNLT